MTTHVYFTTWMEATWELLGEGHGYTPEQAAEVVEEMLMEMEQHVTVAGYHMH